MTLIIIRNFKRSSLSRGNRYINSSLLTYINPPPYRNYFLHYIIYIIMYEHMHVSFIRSCGELDANSSKTAQKGKLCLSRRILLEEAHNTLRLTVKSGH